MTLPRAIRTIRAADIAPLAGLWIPGLDSTRLATVMFRLRAAVAEEGALVATVADRPVAAAVGSTNGRTFRLHDFASKDLASLEFMVDRILQTHSRIELVCARDHRWYSNLLRDCRFAPQAEEILVSGPTTAGDSMLVMEPIHGSAAEALAQRCVAGTLHRRLAGAGLDRFDPAWVFSVRRRDDTVGLVAIEPDRAGDVGSTRFMGLLPDWRGQGLGRALVECVSNRLHSLGCTRFDDATDALNTPMLRAFASQGIREVGRSTWMTRDVA